MSSSIDDPHRREGGDQPVLPATGSTRVETTSADQDRRAMLAEQKERYGGVKAGSAFFGWLTATGTAVILVALLAAAGTVAGMPDQVSSVASDADAATIGLSGAIALLVVLFVAYFCGGYVAGRMARFNGLKQGLAVWLWAVLVAVVVAVLAVVAGDKYNVTDQLDNFPNIPISRDQVTRASLIALAAIAVTSLVAALLGGLAGMHYHRRVDKAGYARA